MAKKNGKSVYIAALLLFLGGLGYLLFTGFSQNSVYFLEVSEALAMTPDQLGSARLFGTVKADNIKRHEEGLGVNFILEDANDKSLVLPVVFKGAVPDTFKAGAEVIVEGNIDDATKAFQARTLMTKCPSKYEKKNRE
ncbi:cytochrome c maturation protein CcmE [Halodesulfovibrio spirochaetisodalis]|uniref:Cytochrome C biogenesis protein CcmE n=1 Tax=Halodesulfovibrio spirochaetisodalis TaxID=1560234 RepID=A0A1B7XFJ2_9BACT|nr:cytochrome c maturation protein CcmE [Halodesulfovibrio spirochaetisodalis]OBQ54018.1 cytochrome C biogenesis protein CcmE [Halodesulfovibrio spirochaetisodalis]